MIEVVGFDLDNTLFEQTSFEFPVFKKISKLISEKYDINKNVYFNELKKLFLKEKLNRIFDSAFLNIKTSLPEDWEKFIQQQILPLYRNFKPKKLKKIKKGFKLLSLAKKYNKNTVLITNGNGSIQRNKIDVLKINSYFDLILISDEFNPPIRKPDIRMFEIALSKFKISSQKMVYIGDKYNSDDVCEKIGIKFYHIKDIKIKDFTNILQTG